MSCNELWMEAAYRKVGKAWAALEHQSFKDAGLEKSGQT